MTLRRPGLVDALLALVVLGIGLTEAATGQLAGPAAVAYGSVLVFAGCLLIRRTSLWAAVLVGFGTIVVSYALGVSQVDYFASIVACLALVWWVGYALESRESVLGFCYAFACVVATNDPNVGNVLWLVMVVGGAWAAGRALRSRRLLIEDLRRTTEELERSREELATRAVAEERLRIAQDIHDVVAHSVTVMLVQAEAAERVMPDHGPARQALTAVQETGRQATTELRQLLGVLRLGPPAADRTSPQPGLRDLPELVTSYAEAGLEVTGTEHAPPLGLPGNVELTAYRVAQEALTNVLKHSSARTASLDVHACDGVLVVDVADAGPRRPAVTAPGHGLAGMRERVQACGGDLSAGPEGAGFRVHVRLPVAP